MKKILIASFLLSSSVFSAVELSRVQTDPSASARIKFKVENESITLEKESNLFDKNTELTLGKFLIKDTKKFPVARLNVIADEIKRTDALLKKKGSSFNELSASKNPHKAFITVGEYKINEGSNYYEELDKMLNTLSGLPKEHVSGLTLSNDLKSMTKIENKAKSKTTPFDLKFSCQNSTLPTTCYFKGEGFLILNK